MGAVIGFIIIGIALIVGFGIAIIANRSVRNYREDQHVAFSAQHTSAK